jgi:hypothetical protein
LSSLAPATSGTRLFRHGIFLPVLAARATIARDKRPGAFFPFWFIPAPDFPKLPFLLPLADVNVRLVKESFKFG